MILKGIFKVLLICDHQSKTLQNPNSKESEILLLLEQSLLQSALMQPGHCLRVMKRLDEGIDTLIYDVISYTIHHYPRVFEILNTVPGVGEITTVTLLAEIGNFNDSSTSDKLASWFNQYPPLSISLMIIVF